MCMNMSRTCHCGRRSAHLSYRDNLLTPEMLLNLYCPDCRTQADGNEDCQVEDCGWILEYDLEGARILFAQRGLKCAITPEFIFDEGYLSWQGMSPGDHQVSHEIHQRLAPVIAQDMRRYLEQLKHEWTAHVTRLKEQGWRKAQQI